MPGTIIIDRRHAFVAKKNSMPTAVDDNVQAACPLTIKALKVVRLLYRKEQYIGKNKIVYIANYYYYDTQMHSVIQ